MMVGEVATDRGPTAPAESHAAGNENSAPACESRGGRDHRCGTFVDGVDDLGVIDPAQVSRRDPEVGMPELGRMTKSENPLTGHLDRVRMPQLVGREPPAGSSAPTATNEGGAPRDLHRREQGSAALVAGGIGR